MFPTRRTLACWSALTVCATLAACLKQGPTPPPVNRPYAVFFGHVTATTGSADIQVFGQAYVDSATAVADGAIFGGFQNQPIDANNNYITIVTDAKPRRLFFNLEAIGTRPSAVDSVIAIPVRFDSLGGGPHDSVEVDFHLP